jgi:hypothetical protein
MFDGLAVAFEPVAVAAAATAAAATAAAAAAALACAAEGGAVKSARSVSRVPASASGGNHGTHCVDGNPYREGQNQHKQKYDGSYVVQSSHIMGASEAKTLGLKPQDMAHDQNYRNNNAFTNQVVHEKIDKLFMNRFESGDTSQIKTQTFNYGGKFSEHKGEHKISPQEMVDRLIQKIDRCKVAGESGKCGLDNPKVYDFLRQTSKSLNMDQRIFNGWQPPASGSSGSTVYQGSGRPRDSDYTAGGNIRHDGGCGGGGGSGGGTSVYQGSGRPRDSDYTAGGNIRY